MKNVNYHLPVYRAEAGWRDAVTCQTPGCDIPVAVYLPPLLFSLLVLLLPLPLLLHATERTTTDAKRTIYTYTPITDGFRPASDHKNGACTVVCSSRGDIELLLLLSVKERPRAISQVWHIQQ